MVSELENGLIQIWTEKVSKWYRINEIWRGFGLVYLSSKMAWSRSEKKRYPNNMTPAHDPKQVFSNIWRQPGLENLSRAALCICPILLNIVPFYLHLKLAETTRSRLWKSLKSDLNSLPSPRWQFKSDASGHRTTYIAWRDIILLCGKAVRFHLLWFSMIRLCFLSISLVS